MRVAWWEARDSDGLESFEKLGAFKVSVDDFFIAPEIFISGIRKTFEVKSFDEDFLKKRWIVFIYVNGASEELVRRMIRSCFL